MLRERLRPVFTTEFMRSTRTLRLAGDSEVEFCLDRGKVTAGSASMPICEMELELKSGNRLSLFQLHWTCCTVFPRVFHFQFENLGGERGYALVSGRRVIARVRAVPVQLAAEMNTSEAFQAIAWNCLNHLHSNEETASASVTIRNTCTRCGLHCEGSARLSASFPEAFSKAEFAEMARGLKSLGGRFGPAQIGCLRHQYGGSDLPGVSSASGHADTTGKMQKIRKQRPMMRHVAPWNPAVTRN